MVPTILPVGNMLMNVMLQMAALAECGQVVPVVVVAVTVEVGYSEHDPSEMVVS